MAPSKNIYMEPCQNLDDLDENTIVISGMSGVYPGCHNVMELADKIYDKQNLLSDKTRWDWDHPEMPKYHGIMPDLDRFDSQFFMVYHKLSHTMDAMTRKLLEQSYQAIFDAGICPMELSGRPVAVYAATGITESEKACVFTEMYMGIIGSNRAMSANRISYYLNLKGPSTSIDCDTCGSMLAVEKAYELIKSGQCEAAIVGGAKLLLHPHSSLHHHKVVPANPDGKMKPYASNADGQSLSEAVNVLFLQKLKDAKRVYAVIRHIKAVFSAPEEGSLYHKYGPYRDPGVLTKFYKEFYEEAQVSPSQVEYIEGIGAAVPEADQAELLAIDDTFCKNRENPLLVGSVTSNIGFTDTASGIAAITKVLLALNRGKIAATINCENPRQDVEAIRTNRMRIVNDHHPIQRTLAAVNNFSTAGVNGHILLQGFTKTKDLTKYKTELPYLVTLSGRTESAVQKILDDLKKRPIDPEEIALLHNIHRMWISKHLARGFALYETNEEGKTVALKEQVDHYDDVRRPLWFVYSGMGSQWAGMGTKLMNIPVFAAAIERCHKVLEPKGMDLVNIITNTNEGTFDNILNSFVGIAAIQIGLTDVLKAVGLEPDNIIGHSVGELGCAYADGCLTAEEMILMAYCRGVVSINTKFIRGSMAAVGIGFKEISQLVPPEIEVACHNGPNSSTISGPADIMKEFVESLATKGIFAKEVPCSNIAYHSRYIAEAGPELLMYLKEILTEPKLRSERWLSTSVPRNKWDEPFAKYSCAEYYTNNLLNPVLFEETSQGVPSNAVLVEIAPHGLLQAILKRSLPQNCHHIPLTRRGHKNSSLFLLEALGKLYMEGYDIDVSALYPKIEFPVSIETRPLSHLVEWVYPEKLKLSLYTKLGKRQDALYRPIISIHDDEYQYLTGHIINGSPVFPFAAALVFAWDTLAMMLQKPGEKLSVKFRDIMLHAQPHLLDQQALYISVTLQRASGHFEVTYDKGVVADGYISSTNLVEDKIVNKEDQKTTDMILDAADVYELFAERGYQYKEEFQSIHKASSTFNCAQVKWNNNWVTFIDAALQLNVLRRHYDGISKPQYIKQLIIDLSEHQESIINTGSLSYVNAEFYDFYDTTKLGGVQIKQIVFKDKPAALQETPRFKELIYSPFFQEEYCDVASILYRYLQIVSENIIKKNLNILYISDSNKSRILDKISDLVKTPPEITLNIEWSSTKNLEQLGKTEADVVFLDDVIFQKQVFEALYILLPKDTFIISFGESNAFYPSTIYYPVCSVGKDKLRLELAKWRPSKYAHSTSLSVKDVADFNLLTSTYTNLPSQHKMIVLTSYPPVPGLKEIVQKLRIQSDKNKLSVAMINHKDYEEDDLDHLPSFDLAFNIFNKGSWGGEYYVPLQEPTVVSNNVALQCNKFGDIDSLHWSEVPEPTEKGLLVNVHYAGLSVYDAKRVSAEISVPIHNGFGMDFSGITERGERVMGLLNGGTAKSKVLADPNLIWPVPKHWTLEDAATVPLAYAQALYCLNIKLRLIRGMTVLVHGGTGAVGQAAISIALANGCKVFATVSDIRKKKFLCQIFPELPAHCIGNSRDHTFEDTILYSTKGEGCHIVISCVKSKLKQATLNCCAASGTVLDIEQIHSQDNYVYGMYNMYKARSYIPIDFSSIFMDSNREEMKMIQLLISEGIARGYVRPLSRVTYNPKEASRAIRLLTGSRHRGRVLIQLQESMPIAKPKITCSTEKSQLIFCDKDGFGLQLADRLVNNGARKLHLNCPYKSGYLEFKIQSWIKKGIHVHISRDHINKKEDVKTIVKECNRLAAVEGIYMVALNIIESKAKISLEEVLIYLDKTSRELCSSLRYFVIISEDVKIGDGVSKDRAQFGLPTLSFHLHKLKKPKSKDESNTLGWRTALEAIEKTVRINKPVVVVYTDHQHQRSLLEEVASIPGVKITRKTPSRTTLEQIGVDSGRAVEFCSILEEKFDILLDKESVPQMTVAEFKSFESQLKDETEKTGLKACINHIESDELLANADMIHMPTLIHTSELRTDELESNLTYLCIVPGLEGHHSRFRTLCERLKIPTMVLQPGFDIVGESVQEMAQRFVDVMLKKLNVEDHFFLLGYEFGILVAVEMAAILESRGLKGTIYCIGGTADEVHSSLISELGNIEEDEFQNELIRHIYYIMTGKDSNEHCLELNKTQSWAEKVEKIAKLMLERSEHTTQYIHAVVNVIYSRIMLLKNYTPKRPTLHSKVIVVKSKKTFSNDTTQYTTYKLNVELSRIQNDLRCGAIINRHLEPEIIDDFNRKNHCEAIVHRTIQFLYGKD